MREIRLTSNGKVVIDGGNRTLTTAGGDGVARAGETLDSTAGEYNNLTIDTAGGAVVFTGNIGTRFFNL